MKITRAFLFEVWQKINDSLSMDILVTTLVHFCENTAPHSWTEIFKPGELRDKVALFYVNQGGILIYQNQAASKEETMYAVGNCFNSGNPEFVFILGLLHGIYKKQHVTASVESVFGKYTLTLKTLLDKNSFWKQPFADSVLKPRNFNEVEKQAFEDLKRSINSFQKAIEGAPHLFSDKGKSMLSKLEKFILESRN